MAEFFKAAARCDLAALKAAPMYVDATTVLEEQHKHERLVEQTLRSRRLLDALDAADAAAATERPQPEGGGGFVVDRSLGADASGPAYRPPPTLQADVPPQERNLGGAAIERGVRASLNVFRKGLSDEHDRVAAQERRERAAAAAALAAGQREAERDLSSLVVARQIAAHEADAQRRREAREATEAAGRRAHPIDVLHARVAQELLSDTAGRVGALEDALRREALGLDYFLEQQRTKELRYKYFGPCAHIPSGLP